MADHPNQIELKTFDIELSADVQEIGIACLIRRGVQTFEELNAPSSTIIFRIWVSPHLTESDLKTWFEGLDVHIIHRPAPPLPTIEFHKQCHGFRLLSTTVEGSTPTDIVLSQGAGFGWGEHETTQMGLSFLSQYLPQLLQGKRILDFGAGTGILSLAAQCCGAEEIYAAEVDTAALFTMRKNVEVNEGPSQFIIKETLEPSDQGFDLILANLYKNVLLAELSNLSVRLTPRGQIWLSGYPRAEQDLITSSASKNGLIVKHVWVRGDWGSSLFSKKELE